jgi:KDO2-lipid IV(A) lauroyltransferase
MVAFCVARTKSPLQIRLEYYPLRGIFGLLHRLPLSWGTRLSEVVYSLLLFFVPKRRRIIEQNLALCFPDKTPPQREAIAREMRHTLARSVAVFSHQKDLLKAGADKLIKTEGFEHLDAALKKGHGAITFTAHYGCWEIMAGYVCTLYPRIAMVTRPLDNPMLEELVSSVRASGGGGVFPSHDIFKQGLRLLRHNGILGILIDQNFYKGGVFVDFFGRPAATTSVVSLLARRTGCAVLPMHNRWEKDHLKIICEPPVALSTTADAEEAMMEDTQTMTKMVEGWVREDPGQWLWLHNRWKRQPEAGEAVWRGRRDLNP